MLEPVINPNSYVKMYGNQTIAGVKTLPDGIVANVTGDLTGNADTVTNGVYTTDANYIDLTDGGATTLHKHDHDNMDGIDLATTGVTYGHIDDQAQSLYGVKTIASGLKFSDGIKAVFGTDSDFEQYESSGNFILRSLTQDKDLIYYVNDGGVDTEIMRCVGKDGGLCVNGTTTYGPYSLVVNNKSGQKLNSRFDINAATAGGNVFDGCIVFININSTANNKQGFYFGGGSSSGQAIAGIHAIVTTPSATAATQAGDIAIWTNKGGDTNYSYKLIVKDTGDIEIPTDSVYLKVGAGADLQIGVVSDDGYVKNVTADKDIIFQVNDSDGGGAGTEVARCVGSTHNFEVANGASGSFTAASGETVTVNKGIITSIV